MAVSFVVKTIVFATKGLSQALLVISYCGIRVQSTGRRENHRLVARDFRRIVTVEKTSLPGRTGSQAEKGFHRLVMNTTPATIKIAPKMTRGPTVSTFLKNATVKNTVKRGVVFNSEMITETSPRPKAIKLQILRRAWECTDPVVLQVCPTQPRAATCCQRLRMRAKSSPGKGPAAIAAAFSENLPGLAVPTMAV
jgi:hypothetical protein